MPYPYGRENSRRYTRVSVQRREPGAAFPASWRRVRRQRSGSGSRYFQMVFGLCLIAFSLVVVFIRILVANQVPALWLSPSSQIEQTNQGSSRTVNFPIKKISRIVSAFSQGDRTQYNNENPQWSQWSYSACSGCALAALMDAYDATLNGRPLKCGDVLEVEYRLSVYNPVNSWGLIRGEPEELAKTAEQFGFTGYSSQKLSLDDLLALANAGTPSIIRIPTHVMILMGGDSQNVFLADSGGLHLSKVTRNQFLHGLPGSRLYAGQSWMTGWYIILTPHTSNA